MPTSAEKCKLGIQASLAIQKGSGAGTQLWILPQIINCALKNRPTNADIQSFCGAPSTTGAGFLEEFPNNRATYSM